MVDDQLMAEGPDCEALVYWASTAAPHLKEVNFLVSAYEMPAERAARLVRLGATGVLLKPISSDTVIQMRLPPAKHRPLEAYGVRALRSPRAAAIVEGPDGRSPRRRSTRRQRRRRARGDEPDAGAVHV